MGNKDPQQPKPGPMLPDSYLTLGGSGRAEIKIQRSRFISLAAPAASEEEARAHVAQMAREYHDSRHVCHAWRLGETGCPAEKANDAGEPSGTAGEPILTALRRLDITNCCAIVVRYFGGVKLGTGGLVRAYGQAADEALAQAPIKEILLGRQFSLSFPYAQQKTITKILENYRGKTLEEEYSDVVSWKIWLPHSTWADFQASLTESSAGKLSATALDNP
jgi:uncharacterized YigZ family protein